MDLQIIVTGLCMFVPDKDGRRTHVLLPRTTGHMKHNSYLYYKGLTSDRDLAGFHLDLSHLGATTQPAPLPAAVADLGSIVGAKVDLSQNKAVAARVTLPAATEIEVTSTGLFSFPMRQPQPLTNSLLWKVSGLNTGSVDLKLRPLSSGAEIALPPPVPSTGVITLHVCHTPENEPKPVKDKEDEHFHLYYALLANPVGPSPVLREEPDGWEPRKCGAEGFGGSPFSCMLATAPPE